MKLKELIADNPVGTELYVDGMNAQVIDGDGITLINQSNHKACIIFGSEHLFLAKGYLEHEAELDLEHEAELVCNSKKKDVVYPRVVEE